MSFDITPYTNAILSELYTEEVRLDIVYALNEMAAAINGAIESQILDQETVDRLIKQAIGAPLAVNSASDMTDYDKVYVYVGSEDGYTTGDWYYYNGSSWVSGGVYNSTAVETDKTLSIEDKAADAKTVGDRLTAINSALSDQPASITATRTYINAAAASRTHKGVTFTRSVPTGQYNNEYTISGTTSSSATAFNNLYGGSSSVPTFFSEPGEYTLTLDTNDENIGIHIGVYPENAPSYAYDIVGANSLTFTLPKLSGFLIRYQIAGGKTVNGTARVLMTHTFNPFIQSTNDDTDRTTEINHRLFGCGLCLLLPGKFYVSGIRMAIGSTLMGCGEASQIYYNSEETGNAITMNERCTVHNLSLYGSESDITLDGNIIGVGSGTQSRCGVAWLVSGARNAVISKCRISRFNCAGIIAADTGTGTDCGGSISDCYLTNNNVGIYVRKDSEYLKITNCTISRNHYGYLNRGGNNDLCGCSVDSNAINAQIDSDEGDNNGHGTITGCSFNHANSNDGYGLIIKNTGRMLVSNCNFYYSKVMLLRTNGNIILGCGFGNSCGLEITNGECNIISNCIMKSAEDFPITLTENTVSQMSNCFTRAGVAITLPS